MPTLTLCRGLPGSGKSTYARERLAAAEPGTLVNVNRDLVGHMLHGGRPHLSKTEAQITAAHHAMVESHLRNGVDVIVDDTNLKSANMRKLCEIGWRCGADVEVVDFDVPVDVCIERDAARPNPVGEGVIRGIERRYLARGFPAPPGRPEAPKGMRYVPNVDLPAAILCDIDGTVALHSTRSPYDTSRYHEDEPNEPVVDAVRALQHQGYQIVFCSGRDEGFRDVTEQWIKTHVVSEYAALHMRPAGDKRRDDIVKIELFDRHIRDTWCVMAAIDDRDRVVRAYRDVLRLQVWQVADGNF